MTSKPQCAALVIEGRVVGGRRRRCWRTAIVERGDHWYCAQHDPVTVDTKALRTKYERIGRLVCERTSELKAHLLSLPDVCANYEGPAMCGIVLGTAAIQTILKEVDAP